MSVATVSYAGQAEVERQPEDLWHLLDPGFLAEAGWDPRQEVLAPSLDHPLLGFRVCRVLGCQGHALLPDHCAACQGAYRRSDLSIEEFAAAGPVRVRRCGEVICSVNGCPRPVRVRRLELCYTHEHQRKRLGLPLPEFLGHPEAAPLLGFGRCRAGVCDRQAHGRRGLCRPHDVRWWQQRRAGQVTDAGFEGWCRTAAPVASGHQVIFRGLTPRVQAEVLFGLQERCRHGALTHLHQLRILCRRLLAGNVSTIMSVETSQLAREQRRLVRDLQDAVSRGGTSPEEEQRKDIWHTAVLGHGRRRVIDSPAFRKPGSGRRSSSGSLRSCPPGEAIMPPRYCKITCGGPKSCRPACGSTAMITAMTRAPWAGRTSSRSWHGWNTAKPAGRSPRGDAPRLAATSR
jgi:hypothetical protein